MMKAKVSINPNTKTTVLYACKVGDPDYMEEVLFEQDGYVNIDKLKDKAQKWCNDNGYNRVRVSVINLSTPPNFAGTVNV